MFAHKQKTLRCPLPNTGFFSTRRLARFPSEATNFAFEPRVSGRSRSATAKPLALRIGRPSARAVTGCKAPFPCWNGALPS